MQFYQPRLNYLVFSLRPTGNYWNAASFPNPSSYLHFSTFQGETSADISFYFKTLIPRGVFLENLGNTDFIKLELKCEYLFSVNMVVATLITEMSPEGGPRRQENTALLMVGKHALELLIYVLAFQGSRARVDRGV